MQSGLFFVAARQQPSGRSRAEHICNKVNESGASRSVRPGRRSMAEHAARSAGLLHKLLFGRLLQNVLSGNVSRNYFFILNSFIIYLMCVMNSIYRNIIINDVDG